jgi:choline dehydrogenase-like flavoprotein
VFIDGRTLAADTQLSTDVCIIGMGPAGITLARTLQSAAPRWNVLCLESGGLELDPATQALAKGDVTGLPYYPLESTRLRYFGGTSGHWAGYCRQFEPIDFEARAWVPHSGWPIRHREVAAYYPQAQQICELSDCDYDPSSWHLADTPPLSLWGNEVRTRLIQFSRPTRFGQRYRAEIAQASDIHVYLNSNVLSIDAAAEGGRVTGLSVGTLQGTRFKVTARIYVLAAGGIENARLLLASNRVVPGGLGNERDLVGRYFAEHMQLDSAAVFPLSSATSFDLYTPESRHQPRSSKPRHSITAPTSTRPIGRISFCTHASPSRKSIRGCTPPPMRSPRSGTTCVKPARWLSNACPAAKRTSSTRSSPRRNRPPTLQVVSRWPALRIPSACRSHGFIGS